MVESWMPGVERFLTKALGGYGVPEGEMVARAVVHHVVVGWLRTMIEWSKERPAHHQASYHFVIGEDGRIVQFVPITTPAWHAGRRDYVNATGRLVDRNDPGAKLVEPTWSRWDPGANPGGQTVAIAREGMADKPWTAAQLDAADRVTAWVMIQHGLKPNAGTLISHAALNPITREHDPGKGWDRPARMEAVHEIIERERRSSWHEPADLISDGEAFAMVSYPLDDVETIARELAEASEHLAIASGVLAARTEAGPATVSATERDAIVSRLEGLTRSTPPQ